MNMDTTGKPEAGKPERDRLDELAESSRERYLDLKSRIENVQYVCETIAGVVLARMDAHEEYHRENEHKWGLVRLAGRHPFRFAILVTGALTMFGAAGADSGMTILLFLTRLAGLDIR